ncbi:GLPGLI family protein [Elizabethkingia meningoseptica]|nr:GLPGLI family protein [Elizabethkingia meningoseptica]MBG0513164.1 GLPGLI family protein [Elizabethkingia meningoseptica]MDE5436076.1 GLPGLI family protein [Elizabethkingia meningoseptica]HAY3556437.1 GLPGLI family protein [Elizabethkingia meningoseptica]HAY3560158.1 GLPGLI family protein [Elizabethkingia meningoseptica]
MKKQIILYILLHASIVLFCQKEKFDYVASYNLTYPINKMKNDEQFLLFMNSKKNISYFIGTNNYVLDSLKRSGRINNDDAMSQLKYSSAFNEEVMNQAGNLNVLENVIGKKYTYDERPDIKWSILKDKKIYNNTTLRKAECFAFGRKWIAWYAEDLALNFSPYKFTGLPGFVYILYDDKQDYYFKLTQFKKKNREVLVQDFKKISRISKEKLKTIRYNANVYGTSQIVSFETAKERADWINKAKEKYNSSPKLDLD